MFSMLLDKQFMSSHNIPIRPNLPNKYSKYLFFNATIGFSFQMASNIAPLAVSLYELVSYNNNMASMD